MKFLAPLLLCLSACVTTISSSEVRDTAKLVIERHNVYVMVDPLLEPGVKDMYLYESSQLSDFLMTTEEVVPAAFHQLADPIINRHQVYVANDPHLPDLDRRVYMRSGQLLLELGK